MLIRDPTMKENRASSSALRLAAESMPASATTTMSVIPCRSSKDCRTGMSVLVSALLPSKPCTSRGTRRVDEQPDLDLWVDAAFLAHPDLAELVLDLGLEVQRLCRRWDYADDRRAPVALRGMDGWSSA